MKCDASIDQSNERTEISFVNQWCLPSKDLSLGRSDIHVWRASLDLDSSQVQILQKNLTQEESAKALRLYFPRDRRYFIVTRALLRMLLGYYLDIEPIEVQFLYRQHGKPTLVNDSNMDALNFNLSHSNGLVLYCVTYGREIGIDIQGVQTNIPYGIIAKKFFSPQEVSMLRDLPICMQKEAFFKCWTRKEAYVKARGEGILGTLSHFDVSVAPDKPAELLSVYGDPKETHLWSLLDLFPGPGFVAALTVEGHDCPVTCYKMKSPWLHKCRKVFQ